MRKYTVIVLVLFLGYLNLDSQDKNKYIYSYDEAGNRKSIQLIHFRKGCEEKITSKIKDCTVKILPNPTNGWLEVTLTDLPKDSKTSINVCNLDGKPIFSQDGIGEFIRIDLGSSPNGFYIMRIVIDGKPLDYKIIKQD